MSAEVEIKKAICEWCHHRCKVAVEIRNGRLVKVEADMEHPWAQSLSRVVRACPRARAAAEWFYHPERLCFPLRRVGERGEGKWERISWEQALDEIADKLREVKDKYGAEAVAATTGTYRTRHEYAARFFNLFGSPNHATVAAAICWLLSGQIGLAMLGWPINRPIVSLDPNTKCFLLIGANPAQSRTSAWFTMLDAKKSGAKLIVIDPRCTIPAKAADIWLQPRPGTDVALLMGMIDVILHEELYDKEFVNKWCYGFDKLVECARGYPLDEVADITWVPAEKIKQAAVMYAVNKPAASWNRMGLEQIAGSTEAVQARFILSAITGNIDVKGGERLLGPYPYLVTESEIELGTKLPRSQWQKMLGVDKFRLFSPAAYEIIQENVKRVWGIRLAKWAYCFPHAPTLFRAMITGEPYPVKAVITYGNEPLVSQPNAKLVYRALKSLELYVVMDFWMTPSAELADYVLPACSWLERPFLGTMMDMANFVQSGEAALPAVKEGEYDRRTDFDLWRGLGIRLGQEEYWPWKTLEEAFDYRLKPLGFTLKDFLSKHRGFDQVPLEWNKYKKKGFATPTGKAELYSTILEKLGYNPLPVYREPFESPISTPELAQSYPLILTTGGRFLPMFHSEQRQVDSLRRMHPAPIVQIHPDKASELGIRDGDWVWIETQRGRVRMKCRYFDGIDPRVVHAEHGWWFPELPGEEPWLHGVWESNINVVTDDDPEYCNKISGGSVFRGLLCKVYKARSY